MGTSYTASESNEESMAKNRILGISPEDTANRIDLFTCFVSEILNDPCKITWKNHSTHFTECLNSSPNVRKLIY